MNFESIDPAAELARRVSRSLNCAAYDFDPVFSKDRGDDVVWFNPGFVVASSGHVEMTYSIEDVDHTVGCDFSQFPRRMGHIGRRLLLAFNDATDGMILKRFEETGMGFLVEWLFTGIDPFTIEHRDFPRLHPLPMPPITTSVSKLMTEWQNDRSKK